MRIIIFGGTQANIEMPVNNRYVVLNTKTLEWYHGKEDPSTRAPFRHHTTTLYNDYMFIGFGKYYPLKLYEKMVIIYAYLLMIFLFFRLCLFSRQTKW